MGGGGVASAAAQPYGGVQELHTRDTPQGDWQIMMHEDREQVDVATFNLNHHAGKVL